MLTTIFGLFLGFLIVSGSVIQVSTSYRIFFEPVGILLVLGGTLTVALITFPFKDVIRLVQVSWAVIKQRMDTAPNLAREIITLARETRGEIPALQSKVTQIRDPFLKDAVNLIIDRLEISDIESILRDRIRVKQETDASTANMLRSLAKYPPSFGIVGTVLGLIAVMQQLGTDANAADKLGPAMAVGLVATFYGLVLTNFVLQPLSENLAVRSFWDVRKRQMTMLGVLLLKERKPSLVVQEAMNSFLPISQRVDVLGTGVGAERAGEAA